MERKISAERGGGKKVAAAKDQSAVEYFDNTKFIHRKQSSLMSLIEEIRRGRKVIHDDHIGKLKNDTTHGVGHLSPWVGQVMRYT